MARLWQRSDWKLMNYGFEPVEGDPGGRPELNEEDESDRFCIQLYHRVASQRDVAGKRVVEIGSGRGGGAAYVHRYLKPASTLGIDLSEAAVTLADNVHQQSGLSYQQGDAENLSLGDGIADIVLNVESSHCYGDMERFLAEAFRILAPGGYLLITDLRLHSRVARFEAAIAQSGFTVEERVDITDGVVRGLRKDTPRRMRMLKETVNRLFHAPLSAFVAIEGSSTFNDLNRRYFVYLCFTLRKPLDN